jgi:fructose-1,6-bisphosphatase/inositol monophosphatase family enzyme
LKNKRLNYKYLIFFINKLKIAIDELIIQDFPEKIKFTSKSKFKLDPVTSLDKKIEKLVKKIISSNFPGHSIIGEEFDSTLKNSEYTWTIDPLDGTKNYILGLPTWSNLIGLRKKKNPILSFANFPILQKYYLSVGKNSYICEKKGTLKKIFANKKIKDLNNAKVAINTFQTIKNRKVWKFINEFKGIIKITNVDAYNFCLLSQGKIDILIESGLKKVDFIPLLALLKNSGAIITDWHGGSSFINGQVLVSANKSLHNKILSKFDF